MLQGKYMIRNTVSILITMILWVPLTSTLGAHLTLQGKYMDETVCCSNKCTTCFHQYMATDASNCNSTRVVSTVQYAGEVRHRHDTHNTGMIRIPSQAVNGIATCSQLHFCRCTQAYVQVHTPPGSYPHGAKGSHAHIHTHIPHIPVSPHRVLEALCAQHTTVCAACVEADAHAHPLSTWLQRLAGEGQHVSRSAQQAQGMVLLAIVAAQHHVAVSTKCTHEC
eukprot:1136774-Pelagomonas_calceolata.AAC.1